MVRVKEVSYLESLSEERRNEHLQLIYGQNTLPRDFDEEFLEKLNSLMY